MQIMKSSHPLDVGQLHIKILLHPAKLSLAVKVFIKTLTSYSSLSASLHHSHLTNFRILFLHTEVRTHERSVCRSVTL
ncbi:hypothetical protein L798_13624 [Zootermopsis nevadensis]|uniref:Uncharacterized protein n=1 Tax=Zootermopsis nevadensis TaxID=136037 RepID=A0A067QSY1_ZOONE|nr:hypothetical protein L798_13624 [Zootermopsis nevadensis]